MAELSTIYRSLNHLGLHRVKVERQGLAFKLKGEIGLLSQLKVASACHDVGTVVPYGTLLAGFRALTQDRTPVIPSAQKEADVMNPKP